MYIFSDDAKFFRQIDSHDDEILLQNDMNEFEKWTNKWLLKANPEKCSTIRIGKKTKSINYKLEYNT